MFAAAAQPFHHRPTTVMLGPLEAGVMAMVPVRMVVDTNLRFVSLRPVPCERAAIISAAENAEQYGSLALLSAPISWATSQR